MAVAGRVLGDLMSARWGFEAIAGHLHVAALVPSASPYAALGASRPGTYWALLLAFILGTGAVAYVVVARRGRP
jgi:hypothetical protein